MKKLEPYSNLGENTRMALSGVFAGFWYTNTAFIFDLLKVRKQHSRQQPKTYTEEIKHIYKTEGLRGFLKGYQGMMLRDAPGFAWYFTFYEWSKRKLGVSEADKGTPEFETKSKFEVNFALVMSGGVAGQTSWLICYPADFLKTRLQTAPPGCTKNIYQIASQIYRDHGILSMYRGIHVQLIRAFPANAVGMVVFEHARNFFANL